ncbi:hypothetical protein [Vibrio crassostreae]|uniref:hypothetical protein n=1 Tax=Vibrio crassostreae TaxID=246167 RepID=UPI001B30374E|nr:hypothetical protein [Vibrio crassostreae]
MKKIFSYLPAVALSTSVFAADGNENMGAVAESLTGQIFSFGNLLVVLMMVLGFWCLYKIVMTFMNRDDERAYPMKNLPLYFAGAAIGLGSALASDLVQQTLFGDTSLDDTTNKDLFEISEKKT